MRYLFTLWIAAAAALPAAETLTLVSALQAVRNRDNAAETRVRMASERLVMLEAMTHHKFELRPQLSLLSLTNPMSLVTGLGLSFLGGNGGVSPVALLSARVDLLEAEVARDRQRFQMEAETTRRFYEVAGRQKAAEMYCDGFVPGDAAAQARKLAAGQITTIEVLRRQRAQLDQEASCRDASRELQLAELRLAKLVGTPAEDLRVQEAPAATVLPARAMLATGNLMETAFAKRSEMTTLDDNVGRTRADIAALREPRSIRVSLFSSRSPLAQSGPYQPALTAGIAFGRDAAFGFEKRLLEMHFRMVEDDLDRLKQDLMEHLAELRIESDARQNEFDAAEKRAYIAGQYRQAIEARGKAGLETADSMATAAAEERRARAELGRAKTERDSALSAVLSLCGFKDSQTGGIDNTLVARNPGR